MMAAVKNIRYCAVFPNKELMLHLLSRQPAKCGRCLILCTITTLGIMTPPVGVAMYVVCGILDCSISEYLRKSPPFFLATLVVISIMIFFPQVVLFLPDLMFGT